MQRLESNWAGGLGLCLSRAWTVPACGSTMGVSLGELGFGILFGVDSFRVQTFLG